MDEKLDRFNQGYHQKFRGRYASTGEYNRIKKMQNVFDIDRIPMEAR
jgi:hypothetical protein